MVINEPSVTTIASPEGMTRSGIGFALVPTHNRNDEPLAKAKGKEVVDTNQGSNSLKEASSQEEVEELLRIINKSNYHVVNQLNHTPLKISLLSLLLSSEAHS